MVQFQLPLVSNSVDDNTNNIMSKEHPNYGGINEDGQEVEVEVDEEDADCNGCTLIGGCEHDVETQRVGTGRNRSKRTKKHAPTTARQHTPPAHPTSIGEEQQPLVPSSIELGNNDRLSNITSSPKSSQRRRGSSWGSAVRRSASPDDLHSLAETVFSDIRSESTNTRISISNDAEEYVKCKAWERAFPERSFALIVTLIFEFPTLFLIRSGGSDRLCLLIGRKKYTTLMALLPLISAISGNVGLQASTLTTRAISHAQVRVDNYLVWMGKEIMAALYLGLAIGPIIACIAYYTGGYCISYAFSIFIAQFIGILTAGVTGTLAPLLFTFIFRRDSGKWGGPLETAVQDVVGSFAMIVVTYRIMQWFGPFELEEKDTC